MKFEELIQEIEKKKPRIITDSRKVQKGDCFVAIEGMSYDGHDYIPQVVQAGAAFVVAEKIHNTKDTPLVLVDNTKRAAAELAQAVNGYPNSKPINLAVTGTNGKTTVAYLVHQIITSAGANCGLIGTIKYDTGKEVRKASLTTPDSVIIAEMAKEMVDNDVKYMVIEASSHALAQNRLSAIDFKAAAFTNLTGDHLDYHKTRQNYLNAKANLFINLSHNALAILNRQDSASDEIAEATDAKIIWYAVNEPADLSAEIIEMTTEGSKFKIKYDSREHTVTTNLLGKHNISNLLAAAGLCLAAGLDLKIVAKALCKRSNVPGRLEKVTTEKDFSVLVDYAHTDDALKNVLTTLKPLCEGRLILVFGCGGDRDRTKRPRMAKVAEQMADKIIVTSDNPRTESPELIIGEIMAGFENPASEIIDHELNRKEAIRMAVTQAQKGDVILIAGKGHEDYQELKDKTIHFSDVETAKEILESLWKT